jgi:hypothetical protein
MIIKEIKNDINFLKKHTLQPAWWKVTKIFVLLGSLIIIFYIFGILKTIIWFSIVLILGAIIHFIYRIKTHTYTKSWMDFKVIEKEGKLTYGRIGFFYYTLVVIIFLIATITILLVQ